MFAMTNSMAGNGIPYGYAPFEADSTELIPVGQGENAYYEVAFCIDPAEDPVWERLKGAKIVGVRCYLNYEYRQKSKKFSSVSIYHNELGNVSQTTLVNFDKGWNDLILDEPVIVGNEKLFVSARVFELLGSPYPFAAYKNGQESFYVNENKKGWIKRSGDGSIMMQVILETDETLLANSAMVQIAEVPVAVKLDDDFDCKLYVHNFSAESLEQITIRMLSDDLDRTAELDITDPIKPYCGKLVDAVLHSGKVEGREQQITVIPETVNGVQVTESKAGKHMLYVSEQVFRRIPLIEEFTGLTCVNCPFMAYYLDIALEEFGQPFAYVAHHAGYVDDELTQEVDRQLLFMFGGTTYNPAVMYDRRHLDGEESLIAGAREASHEPYLNMIKKAMLEPAEAMILVDLSSQEDGTWLCSLEGQLSNMALEEGNFRISTYLVEDSLTTDDYPQMGLDIPGAPADLAERFRHNGVIRYVFNSDPKGDLLMTDGNDFNLVYDAIKPDEKWNFDNCHVISIIHRWDEENLTRNSVLNVGDNRLNNVVGLNEKSFMPESKSIIYCDSEGMLNSLVPVKNVHVYSVNGIQFDPNLALSPGIYLVSYITEDGKIHSEKLMVK